MADLREQLQATLEGIYVLDRELGGGGMSRVFLAHEPSLGRRVVVKVMLPELAAGVSVERFRREIQLLAQLQHPHVVPVLSAGESHGLPYFTMPYIEGEALRARLSHGGELPVREAVRLLRDVASALAYAHGQGVIHRDIKPDNVLISAGLAVVTDFGVAKALSASGKAELGLVSSHGLTSMGLALGTPTYMAPEQAMADPATDSRADIYSFGVMAYEVLTGQPPFTGRSPQAVLAAHATETPEPIIRRRPALPAGLASLVMWCLEKHPADRPQTAVEIMHALDALTTPTGGTVPTTVVRPRRASRRWGVRWVRYGTYAFAGMIGLLALVFFWQRQREVAPTPLPSSRESPGATIRSVAPPVPPAAVETLPAPASKSVPPKPLTAREEPRPSGSDSVMARLRAGALDARRRAQTAGAEASALASGDSMLKTGVILLGRGRRTEAAMQFSQATAAWAEAARTAQTALAARPESLVSEAPRAEPVPSVESPSVRPPAPPPAPGPSVPKPPPDPAPEIRAVVADYAKAIASGSIADIRRVYPALTPVQEHEWEQFFKSVSDIRVSLGVSQLEVVGDRAEARLSGTYEYENSSTRRTERQPVTFRAVLRREAGTWRMSAIR